MGEEPKINFPKTRADCIAQSSDADDGTYIMGHSFLQLIAFEDEKTGRWYMVDICKDCGTPTASFTDKFEFIELAKEYPNISRVGGDTTPELRELRQILIEWFDSVRPRPFDLPTKESPTEQTVDRIMALIASRLPEEAYVEKDLYVELGQKLDKKTWEYAQRHWKNVALEQVKERLGIQEEDK